MPLTSAIGSTGCDGEPDGGMVSANAYGLKRASWSCAAGAVAAAAIGGAVAIDEIEPARARSVPERGESGQPEPGAELDGPRLAVLDPDPIGRGPFPDNDRCRLRAVRGSWASPPGTGEATPELELFGIGANPRPLPLLPLPPTISSSSHMLFDWKLDESADVVGEPDGPGTGAVADVATPLIDPPRSYSRCSRGLPDPTGPTPGARLDDLVFDRIKMPISPRGAVLPLAVDLGEPERCGELAALFVPSSNATAAPLPGE